MIYRITFRTTEEEYKMLFGDSYKKWDNQLWEYILRVLMDNSTAQTQKESWNEALKYIVKAEKSNSQWKSWGGLKWCNDIEFQNELNREYVQENEPDNINPRQYLSMKFEPNNIEEVIKKIKKHW